MYYSFILHIKNLYIENCMHAEWHIYILAKASKMQSLFYNTSFVQSVKLQNDDKIIKWTQWNSMSLEHFLWMWNISHVKPGLFCAYGLLL